MAAKVRVARVGLSIDPKVEVTTLCDEFTIGEEDDVQCYVGTELWAHFPAYIYVYMEYIDDPFAEPEAVDQASVDDEAEDSEEPAEIVSESVAVPVEVDFSDTSLNGSHPYPEPEADELTSPLLN